MKGKTWILLLGLVLICLVSCKTSDVRTYEKKDNMRPAKLIENILDNTPNYHKASYKFSAEYSFGDETPNSFSGIFRVCRDSIIWLSMRSFNIEGFRMLISPDTVKIMDRINNRYYAEDMSALENIVNIDLSYNDLQSILLNEFFSYQFDGDTAKMASDYKSCFDTTYYCISTLSQRKANKISDHNERKPNDKHAGFVQTVRIFPETFRVKSMYIEDLETGRNAFVEYDKFMQNETTLFPQSMNIYVESGNFTASFKFTISDFETNEDLTYPFKVPSKYTKTKLNENNR